MKKIISGILLSSIALTTVACGGTAPSNDTTASGSNTTADSAQSIFGELENLDFGGKTVTILSPKDDGNFAFKNEFDYDTATGDIVEDAIYKRNLTVSQLLNVQIETESLPGGWNDQDGFMTPIRQSVKAGDHQYDIIDGINAYIVNLALEGVMLNMLDLKYVDYSKPWWNSDGIKSNTINGYAPFVAGDFGLANTRSIFVHYFNKKLADELSIGADNVYSIVREGKWTKDTAIEWSKLASRDLNGDTEFDYDNDRWGYVTNQTNELVSAFDISCTRMENGLPVLDMMSEKIIDMASWLNKFYYESDGVAPIDTISTAHTVSLGIFKNSRALIYSAYLGRMDELRDMNDDFGVIPVFKWDEQQENYISHLNGSVTVLGIPMTCTDTDHVAATIEALAIDGYHSILPAYYEGAIMGKLVRDQESIEMIELMREHINFGFWISYGINLGTSNLGNNLSKERITDYASYYASNKSKWEATLKNIIETLSTNREA